MLGIVHIGTEKTGSKTIQEFMHDNAGLLREHGVSTLNLPADLDDRSLVTYAMRDDFVDEQVSALGIEDAGSRKAWRRAYRKEFAARSTAISEDIHTILVSSEHFHSRLVSTAEIKKLHKLLAPLCDEIRIVVYLRRQDRLARSLASTYFKSGLPGGIGEVRDHLDRLVQADHYFNHRKLLNLWASVFGRQEIVPRLFGKAYFTGGELLKDFIQSTALLPANVEYIRHGSRNVSLSRTALMTLGHFRRTFPVTAEESGANARENPRLQARFVAALEKTMAGYPEIFDRAEAEAFYSRFRADNASVARDWFGRDELFHEDFADYPATREEVHFDPVLVDTLLTFFREELERAHEKANEKANEGAETDSPDKDKSV